MRRASSALVGIILVLLSLGIVMLASTSSVRAAAAFNDPQYFLWRQLAWLFIGVLVAVAVARFDYHWWRKRIVVIPLLVVSLALLLLVLHPGIGVRVGGSSRWLRLGPFSLQPSEFAKFGVVIVLSSWMAMVGRRVRAFKEGLLVPLGGLGLVLLLLIREPDFGTTLLTGVVGMLIMFVGGTRVGYLVVSGVAGVCCFALAVMKDPVRLNRILAFVLPERYPATAYHLAQSKYAFINGGWFGVGLGNSIQKHLYLPEAHTDFILAIIGEELGFIATALVVLLFAGIVVCGMAISLRAPDGFGRLLAFGFTVLITLQAAINVGVVTGCLPTKGLPLPFLSYGGSSLVSTLAGVGVLLNIAHHAEQQEDEHTRPIKDRWHH